MAGSRRLETVINAVAERFDHVLLDLPPVLASSDAITLSQLADTYAIVVHQGVTSANQVEAAIEELRGQEALGVILNRYDTHIPRVIRRFAGV
jgi:Mrp family chromosome partitioning ATPase